MKKTLFSLAFVAASGVYVAAANHVFNLPEEDGPTAAEAQLPGAPASIAPSADTAAPALPSPKAATTAVSSAQVLAPSVLSAPAPVTVPAPPAPVIVAQASAPGALAAPKAPTPAMPPIPRPRPTPPAAIEPATTSTVAANSGTGYRDGSYTGSSENAYYGRVQVRVTIASQKIVGVTVLDYPQDRRTSRYINSQALPVLKREVIAADSANVDTVSGATLTSEAYIRSLTKALNQAGGANA
ncbi:MAG: FMN-binding protein [Devosia sp.]